MKKWNWSAFILIQLFAYLGALSNEYCTTLVDCFMLASIIGIPMGLIWAYMGREK